MQNEDKAYIKVCDELIELAQTYVDGHDLDYDTLEFLDDDGNVYKAELIVSFKIEDVFYVLCTSEDDELMVLRREDIHGDQGYVVVDALNELVEVKQVLEELLEEEEN